MLFQVNSVRGNVGRLALLLALTVSASGKPRNDFFAMDTIARGGPDVVVPLLKDVGYDGLGGKALDVAMPDALLEKGLKFYNGYYTVTLGPGQEVPDDKMKAWFAKMRGHNAALWLAVKSVTRADRTAIPNSSVEGDDIAVQQIRQLAVAAAPHGVRIALYPHNAQWLERVEDALRIATKVNRPDVGLTFNLAHWLKVEGSERDPAPVIRAALPKLMFVTINGADTGDTKTMAWTRLIQPMDAGTYDLAKFVGLLRELNYTGPVGFQGYGIKAEPRDVLERSMAAWKRFD